MALHVQAPLFQWISRICELLYFFHTRRRKIIVEVRVVPRKAFSAKQFFVIKRSVRFAELCMPLVGYFAQAMIRWHRYLLRWLKDEGDRKDLHPTQPRPRPYNDYGYIEITRFCYAIRRYLRFPVR